MNNVKMKRNMNAIARYLTILLCLVATACQEHTAIDFDRVEALMDPHPDSALALLDTLHAEPQHYTAKDRARYYLLLTEAKDKCFLTHTTDTLIRFSAEYYEQHNDRHHYAKALYLQGRIYEDWLENEQSAACWVKALDYGKDSEDHYLLYRIAYRLATLYAYQDIADRAMDLYKETLRYAVKTQDSGLIALGHAYIGRIYGMKQDWANASIWYEKGLAISQKTQRKEAHHKILQEYIGICNENRFYTKVDSIITVVNADPEYERDAPYYLCVGNYYRLRKDTARAVPFLQQALTMKGKIYTKRRASQALSYLYDSFGLPQLALHYADIYHSYNDSIQAKEVSKRFTAEVDYQSEQNQASIQTARRIAALLLVLFLLFLVAWQRRKRAQDAFAAEQERQIKSLLLLLHDLEAEKERIEQEQSRKQSEQLVAINQELEREKETIVRKKEEYQRKLASIQSELERLLQPSQTLLGQMRDPKQRRPLTEAQWKEFFVLVDYSQSNFYTNLTMEYPDLKKSDLELCCLIRMGIQRNEEIAALCGISIDAVKKRKQRLKERLQIVESCGNNGDLEAFIGSL